MMCSLVIRVSHIHLDTIYAGPSRVKPLHCALALSGGKSDSEMFTCCTLETSLKKKKDFRFVVSRVSDMCINSEVK